MVIMMVMVVEQVDREDSGVYVCSVSGQAALNISLRVDHAPTINTSQPVYQVWQYLATKLHDMEHWHPDTLTP